MICTFCKKALIASEMLRCTCCKSIWHYGCDNMTTATFMNKNYAVKKIWKCKSCRDKVTATPDPARIKTNLPKKTVLRMSTTELDPTENISSLNDMISTSVSTSAIDKTVNEEQLDECLSDNQSKECLSVLSPISSTNETITTPPDNITQRIKRNPNSKKALESEFLLNRSYQSLPDFMGIEQDIEEIKNQNRNLTLQLECANREVDNLMLGKLDLSKKLQESERVLKMYKSISGTELTRGTNRQRSPANIRYYTPQLKTCNCWRNVRKSPRELTVGALTNLTKRNLIITSEPFSPDKLATTESLSKMDMASLVQKDNCAKAAVADRSFNAGTLKSNSSYNYYKHRVCIFSDEQGRGFNKAIKKVLGEKYLVTSIIKPGATTYQIVNTIPSMCKDYGESDFIIIIPSRCDHDPVQLQSVLYCCLQAITLKANVLLLECFRSLYLNATMVNNNLRFLCSRFSSATYVKISTNSFMREPSTSAKVRELTGIILRLSSFIFKDSIIKVSGSLHESRVNVGTQTDANCIPDDIEKDNNESNQFFRKPQ